MKNLMDFCIGTIVFSLLGYSLMMGQDCLRGLQSIYSLPHRRQLHRRVRIRIQPCFLRNRRNDSFRRYG